MSLLIDVVDSGSFSAAARKLRIPLTTVARKVSDLESILGAKLLIRTTRKLTVTDAGAAYLAAARRIIDQVEDAEREVAGEFTTPKGELVITAPVQFGQLHVLPLVTDFLQMFPSISVRLLLLDRNVQLVEDHIDMAVRIGNLPDSSMIATTVGSMRVVICASPRLLAAHGVPKDLQELEQIPCVSYDGPAEHSQWHLRDPRTGEAVRVPVSSRLTVTTVEAAVQAALRDVGLARLLHYQVAEAVKAGTLQIVMERFEPSPAPVSLIHAAHGQMPLKMRCFLDFAAPRLKEALSSLQSPPQSALGTTRA